jgi:hypothetical protein
MFQRDYDTQRRTGPFVELANAVSKLNLPGSDLGETVRPDSKLSETPHTGHFNFGARLAI